MEKKYIIKPVVKAKFSGISSLTKTRTIYTGAQMDKFGSYKTGLTLEEERKFEEELGYPKNHLNKKNVDFWAFLEFRLNNDKETVFIVETPLDEIKWRALTNRNQIAKSELDIANNPLASFYVEDKEAKAKITEKKADMKLEALDIFQDMTVDEKKGILKLYNMRGVDDVSDRQIKATLYEKIEEDVSKFLGFAKDKDLKTRILVEDLLEKGILKKKGSYYVHEDESIGSSIESVIEYLNDPKRQSVKIVMTQEAKKVKSK